MNLGDDVDSFHSSISRRGGDRCAGIDTDVIHGGLVTRSDSRKYRLSYIPHNVVISSRGTILKNYDGVDLDSEANKLKLEQDTHTVAEFQAAVADMPPAAPKLLRRQSSILRGAPKAVVKPVKKYVLSGLPTDPGEMTMERQQEVSAILREIPNLKPTGMDPNKLEFEADEFDFKAMEAKLQAILGDGVTMEEHVET